MTELTASVGRVQSVVLRPLAEASPAAYEPDLASAVKPRTQQSRALRSLPRRAVERRLRALL